MHPDRGLRRRRTETEALGEALPIAAIPQATPQQHEASDRREEVDDGLVDELHHRCAGAAAASVRILPSR